MQHCNYYNDDCVKFSDSYEGEVDSVVTDPPYGIEYLGNDWDSYQNCIAFKKSTWESISKPLKSGGYLLIFGALIAFFAFFYTAVVFNPEETADNLKKNGGFIPGIRPGKNTADHLDYILTRLTVVGAIYLVAVAILPEILISKLSVPFFFGGTSLLIVVSVTLDTVAQVQSHLLAHQYEGLIKKSRLRGRRG